jgi:upstream activation factor subunit UAF30
MYNSKMPPAKKSTKAPATEVKAEAVAPVVEVKVEGAAAPAVVESGDISSVFTDYATKLAAARALVASLTADFKTLQKRSERELKAASKAGVRRRNKNANRAPSGFVKPTLISDQLADFLTKPKGTLIARTEVTREINAYIRSNKLQDPANGRKINPDAKLKKLLALKPTDELTYFNLQRYMSQHFQKSAAATPVA